MSGFKKAERKQTKLKLAITGPSGAGKTFSALRLASGIGTKIALIDTENGSASLYADRFDFDVLEITPPFTIEKYQSAIETAEKKKYDIIVIDSISHSWAGEGGLLDQKEQLDARGGKNSFTNWASITKKQEQFKNHILHSPCHVICTMRSKQEYVLQEKDGKQIPKKIGMAPVQRDGIEYEFTTVFDVAINHEAQASKDRTGLFTDKIFKITEETGLEFLRWLLDAKTVEKVEKPSQNPQEYIVNIKGGKWYGKKLTDIPSDTLQKFADHLNIESEKRSLTNDEIALLMNSVSVIESRNIGAV